MNIHWTCLLPHQSAQCVLRYEDRRPQAGEEHPRGGGEGPQGHKEEEGVQQDQVSTSQATTCPRASKTPCARATQRAGAGAPRAHGPVPCPRDPRAHGPNLPRAHGLIRMGGCDPQSEPLFTHFDPKTIYSVPRPFVRVSKGYDMIYVSFAPCTTPPLERERETSPLEIKTSYGEDP